MVISIGVQLIGFGILIFLSLHSIVMITLGILFIYISFSALTVIINIEILLYNREGENVDGDRGIQSLSTF